jgi:hypothetical protein
MLVLLATVAGVTVEPVLIAGAPTVVVPVTTVAVTVAFPLPPVVTVGVGIDVVPATVEGDATVQACTVGVGMLVVAATTAG